MQVKVKTLLNQTQTIPGFRYADVRLIKRRGMPALRVDIEAHAQRPARCSICERPAPTYDHLKRESLATCGASGLYPDDFLLVPGE